MTVSYQYYVASSTSGGFIRLLFRWRGSVWKLVYREFAVFTGLYIMLTLMYRFGFTEFQKRYFELLVYFCGNFSEMIPLPFILGFYVSFTATRWWNQYTAIPWPDKLMNIIALYVTGADDTSRMIRRSLLRYVNLSLVLVLRSISMAVKRRFPTKDHLVEAGFMSKPELEMFSAVPSTEFNTFWIPCTWFINLLRESRQECRITDSNGIKLMMEELNEFRSKCGLLWSYDWISIPLVYTQVVTMATYAFFGAAIIGRQFIQSPVPEINNKHKFDFFVPLFTILQFFFYMGLLKVAEQLVNPFGDDDEDFELNWMIDRHLKVSYLGVDTLNCGPPPLMKDSYFNESDIKLPYTAASVSYKKKTYRGSVANMYVPTNQQNLVVPEISESDEEMVLEEQMTMGNRRPSVWTIAGGKIHGKDSPLSSSVTNLQASDLYDSTESLTGPGEVPTEIFVAPNRRSSNNSEQILSTGTSGVSPEETMDRLGVPGQPISAWSTPPIAKNSQETPKGKLTKSSSERGVPRPPMSTFKGLMKRFKPPPKHYPKQFTVRPYFATVEDEIYSVSREESLTPTLMPKGVTFSSDTKSGSPLVDLDTQSLVVFNTDVEEGMRERPSSESAFQRRLSPTLCPRRFRASTPTLASCENVEGIISPSPISSVGSRRLSLDTSVISGSTALVGELNEAIMDPEDGWLRHSSLPNVQEVPAEPRPLTPDARSVSGFIEIRSKCRNSPQQTLDRPSTSLSPHQDRHIRYSPIDNGEQRLRVRTNSSDSEIKFADDVP